MHAMKRIALHSAVPAALFAALLTTSRDAGAQAAPATPPTNQVAEGISAQSSASSGQTTVVAKDTFGKAKTLEEIEEERTNASQASVQAGGLFATGNARSLAITAAADLRIRRAHHQFGAAAAANYGRAGTTTTPIDTTVQNLQGLVRYDYFLNDIWSLFLQTSGRHDRFQGLDFRANIDPGASAYVLNDKKHRLWFELGYDFQYDVRRRENVLAVRALPAEDGGDPAFARTIDRHNVRGFVGYDNQLNSHITFTTGLEYLQPFAHASSDKRDPIDGWRFTWNNALKSSLSESFSAATTFTLRYDNLPLPGVEKLDALTAVNLIYTFQ